MKTGKKSITFNIAIILYFLTLTGFSQDEGLNSKVKTIEKIYSEPNIEYFGVTNSFGNIDISRWDENKVKVTVTLTVIAWEEDDADRFLEKLIPEMSISKNKKGNYDIYCATNVSNIKNLCKCDETGKKIYAPWFRKNAEVKQYKINYDVKIPETIKRLSLFNRYGNINIPDFKGKISINLSNGNLKTGDMKITGECPGIHVRYGKVHIEAIENSKANLYSCKDVQIGRLVKTNLTSKFSDIQISSCSGLTLNSRNDNFVIDNLESMIGTGNFTSLKIKNMESSIDFSNKSGEIEIGKINPDFKLISLNGQFNDYILNLDNLSYSLTADLEFTDLKSTNTIYPEQKRNELINGKALIERKIGDLTSESHIMLECSNCNVDLK